jgi:ArsR family transcriptional regulator
MIQELWNWSEPMNEFPRVGVLAPPGPTELAADERGAVAMASAFHALADPRRLQLLHLLLTRDEMCVCELLGVLGLSPSNLSFHLNVLRQAGFLRSRRQGRWIFYAVERERLAGLQRLFAERFDPLQAPLASGESPCCEE